MQERRLKNLLRIYQQVTKNANKDRPPEGWRQRADHGSPGTGGSSEQLFSVGIHNQRRKYSSSRRIWRRRGFGGHQNRTRNGEDDNRKSERTIGMRTRWNSDSSLEGVERGSDWAIDNLVSKINRHRKNPR